MKNLSFIPLFVLALTSLACYAQSGVISTNLSLERKIEEFISKESCNEEELYDVVEHIQNIGDLNLGLRAMNAAITKFSNNYFLYYMRGFYHKNLFNNEAAITDFTSAISLEPRYANTFLERGECYARINKKSLAEKDFNSTLVCIRNLKSEGVDYTGMDFAEQFALVGLGRYKEVESWIKTYKGDDLYNIACLYSKMKNKNATLNYIEKAINDGYADIEFIERDACMNWLHNDTEFLTLITKYKK